MTSDHRVTPGLIHDILDALERHGYYRSDDLHADRAIGLIGDLACIYEGTQDHPAYPGAGRQDVITLTRDDASTVFAAAEIAADDKRYHVEMCPDCPDRSCPDCQTHLRDAQPSTRWPTACSGPPRPPPLPQPASPGQIAGPSLPPTGRPASDARPPQTGRTSPPPGCYPLVPDPRPGERDMPETADPCDLPFPDYWPRRPEDVIVVDQLRGWRPGQPPSLAELLEAGPARTRKSEPDLEAEP